MQEQYERMKRDHGIDEMLKDSEDEAPDQYIGKHSQPNTHLKTLFLHNSLKIERTDAIEIKS